MKFGNLERKFAEGTYSDNVDRLNTGLIRLTFEDNFVGKLVTIGELAKDAVFSLAVGFKITGYLILNQEGNGVISRTSVQDKFELINYGPNVVKNIKVFVMG